MPDWVSSVGGLVGAVVALGAIVQYLRRSSDKGTITTLESSNESLLQWQAIAKAEIAELKEKVTAATTRIAVLEAENADLRAKRPSADAIADVMAMQQVLHEQITAHDEEVRRFMAKVEDGDKR